MSAEGFGGGTGVDILAITYTWVVSIPPKYSVSAIMGYLKGKLFHKAVSKI